MEIDETHNTVEAFKNQDSSVAAEIYDSVVEQLPAEKKRAERELNDTAKAIRETSGSHGWIEGVGQPVASIPPLLHIRWHQLYPGCWKDRQFVDEFLADNPQCQMPGYKPKPKTIYFDMGASTVTTGADVYQRFKAQVNSEVASAERRLKEMGLSIN